MPAKAYHTVVAHDAMESHHSSLLVFWPSYEPRLDITSIWIGIE
jgi:hypothetical protein